MSGIWAGTTRSKPVYFQKIVSFGCGMTSSAWNLKIAVETSLVTRTMPHAIDRPLHSRLEQKFRMRCRDSFFLATFHGHDRCAILQLQLMFPESGPFR